MKIIIFGLGSIGKRQAKLLKDNFSCQLYAFRSGLNPGKEKLAGITQVYTWKQVSEIEADAAFITNPTFLHIDTALNCARLNLKLFIEKPLGSSLDNLGSLLRLVQDRNLVSYVAYNLRFHPVIQWLKKYLKQRKVNHVSISCASFLPAWRPGRSHLATYSARKQYGGGVILDVSHEFDYIAHLFGQIQSVQGTAIRASKVTIDAEDCLDAIIRTPLALVNLHLDCLSLKPERTIKIDLENGYILADLNNSRVEGIDGGRRFNKSFLTGTADTYLLQLKYFFKNINNACMMNNLVEAAGLFKKIVAFRQEAYGNMRNNSR